MYKYHRIVFSHLKKCSTKALSTSTNKPCLSQAFRLFSATSTNNNSDSSNVSGLTSLNTFTEDELMLRQAVSTFATEQVMPKVREMDDKESLDPSIRSQLFEQGLMGIEIPDKYNGTNASFMSCILAIEELSKIDPSVAVLVDVHNTLVNTMFLKYCSVEDIKQKYLTKLATDTVGSFCLSESGSGSDAFKLKTKAEKSSDGSYYSLNGSKMWISNSLEAEIFLVFANVDPSKGYKGITCFIVEKEMGVSVAKKENKLGIRCSSTCVLNFDNVKVPSHNVLGEIGKGYKYAIEILNEGRIGIAAQMTGLAQGAFDMTMPYMFERVQFNNKIGLFQGMQFQHAQALTDIECARLLTYNAARLKMEGKNFVTEAAMAKLKCSQIAQKVASQCIDWMGGVGFTRDFIVEKMYRDAKIGAIYEGTSNIQLQTIAKAIAKKYNTE